MSALIKKMILYGLSIGVLIAGFYIFMNVFSFEEVMVVDFSFQIGISSLMVGVTLYILKSGFLTPFLEGFKTVQSAMFRKSKHLIEEDKRLFNNLSLKEWKENIMQALIFIIIFIGSALVLFSFLLLI
jgi:hypothetical protein